MVATSLILLDTNNNCVLLLVKQKGATWESTVLYRRTFLTAIFVGRFTKKYRVVAAQKKKEAAPQQKREKNKKK